MKITITGRKVSLRDNFKERVEKKLKKFGRMFGEDASASVTVTVEKRRQTVEVTIRTADGTGVPLRANRSGNERRSG